MDHCFWDLHREHGRYFHSGREMTTDGHPFSKTIREKAPPVGYSGRSFPSFGQQGGVQTDFFSSMHSAELID